MTYFLAIILSFTPVYQIRFHIYNLPTTLLEVLTVGFLFLTIANLRSDDFDKLKSLRQINWAIGLFILAGLISIFVAPNQIQALGQFKAFIFEPVVLFYASIITIRSKDQLQTILRWLFLSTTLIALFGIFQYFTLIHLPLRFWGNGSEVLRITSIFEYPNALSLYLGPLLGFFAALFFSKYELLKNKWLSIFGLLLIATALLLTFSRGAWIAGIIGLLVILSKRFEFKKIVLPIILLGTVLIFIPSVQHRLSIGLADPSSSAHWDLMKNATNQIIHNPIFGNGLLGFKGQAVMYPHNIILNFWTELGIMGLISFIWILVLAYKQYKKKPQLVTFAAVIYLLVLLVHGLVDVPYFKNDLSVLFWFMIAIFYL